MEHKVSTKRKYKKVSQTPAVYSDDSRMRFVVRTHAASECDDGTRTDRDAVVRPRRVVKLLRMPHRVRLAQLVRAHNKVDRAFH